MPRCLVVDLGAATEIGVRLAADALVAAETPNAEQVGLIAVDTDGDWMGTVVIRTDDPVAAAERVGAMMLPAVIGWNVQEEF